MNHFGVFPLNDFRYHTLHDDTVDRLLVFSVSRTLATEGRIRVNAFGATKSNCWAAIPFSLSVDGNLCLAVPALGVDMDLSEARAIWRFLTTEHDPRWRSGEVLTADQLNKMPLWARVFVAQRSLSSKDPLAVFPLRSPLP